MEIDFVTPIDASVVLIEVKAKSGNAKSANTILKNKEQYGVSRCIKLSANNIGQDGDPITPQGDADIAKSRRNMPERITIPYYMGFLLRNSSEITEVH
ncbi:MAG: hypothetical protein J6O55_03085 [Lachnospiraceae bacterium]|nr:hypothetical protein [Lachnospiraceae bacterium]